MSSCGSPAEPRSRLVAELQQQEQAERYELNDDHSDERGAESGAVRAIAGGLFGHIVVSFEEWVGTEGPLDRSG